MAYKWHRGRVISMWTLFAAVAAESCTTGGNTSIQQAAIITAAESLPPPQDTWGWDVLNSLLEFFKEEINSWLSGLALELESYESRDPNNTRFQLVLSVTIYILVAFNLEFYQWGKHIIECMHKQKNWRSSIGQGKRITGKSQPKEDKARIKNDGSKSGNKLLNPPTPRRVTKGGSLHFFTPPSSPTGNEKRLVSIEIPLHSSRDSLAAPIEKPVNLTPKGILRNRSSPRENSLALSNSQSTNSIDQRELSYRSYESSHGNNNNEDWLPLKGAGHYEGSPQSEGSAAFIRSMDRAPTPPKVSFASSVGLEDQNEDVSGREGRRKTRRSAKTARTLSPPRVSFSSSVGLEDQNEDLNSQDGRRKTRWSARTSSPPRVSFSSRVGIEDQNDDLNSQEGKRQERSLAKTSSPPRVSFSSSVEVEDQNEDVGRRKASSSLRTPSPPRVSFASSVKVDDENEEEGELRSSARKPRVSFSPTIEDTNIHQLHTRTRQQDEDMHRLDTSRDSSISTATSPGRAASLSSSYRSNDGSLSSRPSSIKQKSGNNKDNTLQKVIHSYDNSSRSNARSPPPQPFVCVESSIDDMLETEEEEDNDLDYSNNFCGIGQESDDEDFKLTDDDSEANDNNNHHEVTLKSEEDEFNDSVLERFGSLSPNENDDYFVSDPLAPQIGELEQIALALKNGLTYRDIKNRLKKKKYKDCFSGSAAVDFLSQHLRKPRKEALQIGRMIAMEYKLFVKCGSKQKKKQKKNKRKSKRSDSATRREEGFDLDQSYKSSATRREEGFDLDQSHKSSMSFSMENQSAALTRSAVNRSLNQSANLNRSANLNKSANFNQSANLDQSFKSATSYTNRGEDDDDEEEGEGEGEGGKMKSSLLQDSRSIYYRLFAFLPSEVESMPTVRKMRIFEEGVSVKNRRRRRGLKLKKHKQSFSGKDAVSFLVRCKLCASREEGVELCNEFMKEFNLLESVKRLDDAFKDSGKSLYQFVDKKNRYFNIDDRFSTKMVEFQGNAFDWESRELSEDEDGFDTTTLAHSKATFFDFDSMDSDSDTSDLDEQLLHELRPGDYQRLCEVAEILERGVALKKQGTFVASRAVTFMVTSGLAESRKQAEVLGRRLEREFNLMYEITGKHDFSDSNHFFKFTDKHERHSSPLKVELPLDEIAEAFEQGVKVKDYVHNLKTYKQSFVGTKAVDFLVNSRLAKNRVEAVRIGRLLVEHYNLFEARIKGGREFCDDYVYFRFTLPENRKVPDPQEENLIEFRQSTLDRVKSAAEELSEITDWFLNGVKVKDNKFRAKNYRNTFVGTDAVSYMVNNSRAVSRKEAVELGRSLCQEVGLFKGIDGSTDFRDDYLLYRFEENFRHSLSEDQTALGHGMVTGLEGISGVSAKSLPLEKIARAFRDNMQVSDHHTRRKVYEGAFEGREAVDFLVGHGLSKDRVEAVGLGRAMAREFGLFAHVKNEHEFKDAKHHYRFCYEGEIRALEDVDFDKVRLSRIARAFLANIKVQEHRKKLLVFKDTFVGSEAVDFLVRTHLASSRKEAVQLGRAITKEFNLFDHVTQDRKFEDSEALFHFQKEEDQYKGLMFERQGARRNVLGNWNISLTTVEDDDSLSSRALDVDEEELANKIALFKAKVQRVLQPHIEVIEDDDDSVEQSRKFYRNKFMAWATKFRRLDPRHQIQHYFESVAHDGAAEIENKDFSTDDLNSFRVFLPNRAHVFTVWRPTALHAIRKMMKGEGVGKGLDIKGKSAKRGKISGYVPFLQIGDNKHKHKIRPPSKQGVVRVFYPSEARRARDIAADILERVGQEMIATVAAAKKVLVDKSASQKANDDALATMLLDMSDPKIVYIDDYAPQSYGLEIPERLFWEAYFTRQDCTRKPGSEHDTGRPSQPAFQDMNFATLRSQPKEGAPRACVFQHADPGEPMNPFELLMAYEEHNRVMPVVSDFDCFLVGTQSVVFTSPLPRQQLDVLSWSVSEIQNTLATSIVGDSWTVRWLEVLKRAAREGIHPEMPRFGFGDPKSYAIMGSAVSHLKDTGAVRHGAECFNYYFPQDLDDEYLVISGDLPGNKPWVYVDEAGLTKFLSKKVDEGFTFPLNPKWILCDSGDWYDLYQKLLRSPYEDTQKSMNVWFPPDSGLREKIEKIHKSRPEGFYEEPMGSDIGDMSIGLESRKSFAANRKKKEHLMSMFAMGLLEKPKDDSTELIDLRKSSSRLKRARQKVTKAFKGKGGGKARKSVAESISQNAVHGGDQEK